MEKNHSSPPTGSGLELDKIEIPTRSSLDTVHKSTSDADRKPALSPETTSPGKKHLRMTLAAVITTLALLTALAVYLKKQDMEVSHFSVKNTAVSENYLRVGPISATMKNNKIIRLSVDIGCENNTIKKRLAEKDSLIRDKIVSVLTAPGTDTLLKKHQYDDVRAKIKESLEKIYGESIGEVYFAELLTY